MNTFCSDYTAIPQDHIPTVSVIVPAYNAEKTIDETLKSIRAQTYRKLEILVVDDGSTDTTAAIIQAHAVLDQRVRLIAQQNSGVATARNRGIMEAAGDYVAPTDADDLWHQEKITTQMSIFTSSPQVGLVFTMYSVIDENSEVVAETSSDLPDNINFNELCKVNFIGNGSSALMRKDAVIAVGGYDSSLHQRGAQGCEDLKLYLQIAENYGMDAVRLPLTGYRQLPQSMSSNGLQMLKSFDFVAHEFCSRRPELVAAFEGHRVFLLRWLILRSLSGRHWQSTRLLCSEFFRGPRALVVPLTLLGCRRLLMYPLRKLKSVVVKKIRKPYLLQST